MPEPTIMFINSSKPYAELGENSRIALGVLREDGWKIDRIDPNQKFLMVATPYYTRDEEQIVAARIEAMEAAHKHRIAAEYKGFAKLCGYAAAPLLIWGGVGLGPHFYLEAGYVIIAGLILSALSFTLVRKGEDRG